MPLALLIASLASIAALWWWLALPITLERAPIDPAAKLDCVSYAPFRGAQNPLDPSLRITAGQIAEDLKQLATITPCIRTYSVDNGLDQVPQVAATLGLKVIHGIWLGSDRVKNQQQIGRSIALAKEFPGVITSIVVGNEVLLRGEMTVSDLVATIRSVRAAVNVPVTYADVWEFWLRNRELVDAVDFVTIHILPYWEDFPVRARNAAAHVEAIRSRVAVAFPGKEILIGETGWPSAGRMRAGALPSRANQARVVSEILAMAKRENYRVNLIEAYDQPWKRQLEGTAGGYWGLITSDSRQLKYPPGEPIRNYPFWRWQAGGGILFCLLIYLTAMLALRRKPWSPRPSSWIGVSVSATTAGMFIGIAAERMVLESLGVGGYLQWGALLAASIAFPLLTAIALMRGDPQPSFVSLVGPAESRTRSKLQTSLGVVSAIAVVVGAAMALGFVFDPRYRDFPYLPLTICVVPMLALSVINRPLTGERPIAEMVFAGVLLLSAGYVAFNEGYENWQAMWSCAAFALMAFTLWRVRVVQIPAPEAQQQSPTG